MERGFDRVTLAEIAAAADVSEGTVYNYFPAKEDLFFSGMEVFEERLVDAVADRPAGESVLDAFRRVVLDGTSRLADPAVAELARQAVSTIRESPTLRAREREIVAHHTARLAALIAHETGAPADDPTAATAAGALMSAQRAIVAYVHARAGAGERGPKLASSTRREGRKAFALLEQGLGGFAVR
jgi:AcrR family transcriptional regulator